jgi:predicted enzyme related to lactoylglutathione lyase
VRTARSVTLWSGDERFRRVRNALRFEGLTLTVESVARSVEFYGKLLELTVAYNAEPDFAMIKVGEGTIGLLSAENAAKEGARPMGADQRRAIHVEFTTDDLDSLYEELTARGMTFHDPPHDEPWERVMTGFDPDGYSVEFAQGRRGNNATTQSEVGITPR